MAAPRRLAGFLFPPTNADAHPSNLHAHIVDCGARGAADMLRGVKKVLSSLLVVAAVLTAGCAKHWMPSERSVYAGACAAVRSSGSLPAGATLPPIEGCRLYVGKSAARVDVPVTFADGSDTYVVWLKRIDRRWLYDRLYRTSSPRPAG